MIKEDDGATLAGPGGTTCSAIQIENRDVIPSIDKVVRCKAPASNEWPCIRPDHDPSGEQAFRRAVGLRESFDLKCLSLPSTETLTPSWGEIAARVSNTRVKLSVTCALVRKAGPDCTFEEFTTASEDLDVREVGTTLRLISYVIGVAGRMIRRVDDMWLVHPAPTRLENDKFQFHPHRLLYSCVSHPVLAMPSHQPWWWSAFCAGHLRDDDVIEVNLLCVGFPNMIATILPTCAVDLAKRPIDLFSQFSATRMVRGARTTHAWRQQQGV